MEQEIWKSIKGYEGLYKVSNLGNIKSSHKKIEIILKPYINKDGYCTVSLKLKGIKKGYLVHSLVATYFIDNPYNLNEVNHKDFIRHNNHYSNLEWVTHGDNIRYGYKLGKVTGSRGEKSPMAKHTNESVLKIRELYKTGIYTQQELADMFNDKRNNISKILNRTRWTHI